MKNENPLISIVIPVYKVEKFLGRCVESAVNQTYKNLEIFLIDDGSPDNCPKICDDWASKDDRIKVIHLENAGVANARNTALKQATGDYIGFIDGDDYVEPDMYQQLVELAMKYNSDITFCSYQINDEDRGEAGCSEIPKDEVMKNVLMGEYEYGVLWNKLYKKSVVKDLEMPPLKCSQDLPYNYFAMKNADKFVKTELKLYHYYQNEASTMHSSFSRSKYDAVKARKIMINDVTSVFKPYAVYGLVLSLYVFLSQSLTTNQCEDMRNDVRKEILIYKKEILQSDLFSKKDKLKTVLLSLSLFVYKTVMKIIK